MRKIKNKKLGFVAFACALFAGIAVSGLLTRDTIATSTDTTTITYPYYAFVEDPEHPWQTVYDALDATDTIDYSDAYFNEPSPGDHPELRAVSYALALAGFENTNDGYPSSTTSPNPKLYNMLDQMGFTDYQSWDLASEKDGHSMGTTIGRKKLANGQDLIVVAPRNYNYMTEWLSNFDVGVSGDHNGIAESANFITSRFDSYINSRNLSNYKVWVVGYSRGGAVIDLFARNINANLTNYEMTPDDFYAYTFGAPRASLVETAYNNIHDVKDGNDLLLGYLFPEAWGFHNTGTYEEIHPADLEITESVVDISNLVDPAKAMTILSSNTSMTQDVGTINGKQFMDDWLQFVIDNGLTRDYFNANVRPPLSAIMQAYQLRTLDKQPEFLDFIKSTQDGMAAMVAGNALADIMSGKYPGTTLEEILQNFPPYLDLVKILEGTATDADVDEFLTFLDTYMGNYSDYESAFGKQPVVTEEEFNIIKTNLPELVRALAPFIIADAAYTQAHYGENYSLYYTYTLASNAKNLVIGHIPESLMPILKSLIPGGGGDDPVEPVNPEEPAEDSPAVPDTGYMETVAEDQTTATFAPIVAVAAVVTVVVISGYVIKKKKA